MSRHVSPDALAEMLILAAYGASRQDISAQTGWSYKTVNRHVGRVVNGVGAPVADLPRYRRMIKAAASAGYGEWDGIARRFGLKNAKVLGVVLVTARRRIAQAEGQR